MEVSLFLGLSGLLTIGLIAGLTSMVRRQQWHTSMTDMQTIIQSQFQDVVSGINDRSAASAPVECRPTGTSTVSAGASDCYVLGRLINFGSATYSVYDVYATKEINNDASTTAGASAYNSGDVLAIVNSNPKTSSTATVSNSKYPGGNTFSVLSLASASVASGKTSVAILKSPLNGSVMTFALPGMGTTGAVLPISSAVSSGASPNQWIAVGIKDSGYLFSGNSGGAICIGSGATASDVKIYSPISDVTTSAKISSSSGLNGRCK